MQNLLCRVRSGCPRWGVDEICAGACKQAFVGARGWAPGWPGSPYRCGWRQWDHQGGWACVEVLDAQAVDVQGVSQLSSDVRM